MVFLVWVAQGEQDLDGVAAGRQDDGRRVGDQWRKPRFDGEGEIGRTERGREGKGVRAERRRFRSTEGEMLFAWVRAQVTDQADQPTEGVVILVFRAGKRRRNDRQPYRERLVPDADHHPLSPPRAGPIAFRDPSSRAPTRSTPAGRDCS